MHMSFAFLFHLRKLQMQLEILIYIEQIIITVVFILNQKSL